jgi:predicted TIM-barrel fold metal-dependent hydrolase
VPRAKRRLAGILVALVAILPGIPVAAQARDYPIIDVHVHAHRTPPPRSYCPLTGRIEVVDEDGRPLCPSPLRPAADGTELMERTLAIMERNDMIAVAMTQEFEQLQRWMATSPRILPSIQTGVGDFEANGVRALVEAGDVMAIGELMTPYEGIAPDAPEVAPIWTLAEAHDVPVGIHMSAPGARLSDYRAALGNPLLLEPVLRRHPTLRVSLMHAGWPFLEETVALLRQYPNVYVDISFIDWQMPRPLFHEYLERLIAYGYGKRIMFGTDQNWPDAIEIAIRGIEDAPFLSAEQKKDIFFANAVRFFRLDAEEILRR